MSKIPQVSTVIQEKSLYFSVVGKSFEGFGLFLDGLGYSTIQMGKEFLVFPSISEDGVHIAISMYFGHFSYVACDTDIALVNIPRGAYMRTLLGWARIINDVCKKIDGIWYIVKDNCWVKGGTP